MSMPRSREQVERAAVEAEAWLDGLDPDDDSVRVDDPADLRQIARALHAVVDAEQMLTLAISAARANGRSWNEIARIVGMSRQATQKRYDRARPTTPPDLIADAGAGRCP
jgi:DNA-directed RNA polymerase specialized sigma24 family protein